MLEMNEKLHGLEILEAAPKNFYLIFVLFTVLKVVVQHLSLRSGFWKFFRIYL